MCSQYTMFIIVERSKMLELGKRQKRGIRKQYMREREKEEKDKEVK